MDIIVNYNKKKEILSYAIEKIVTLKANGYRLYDMRGNICVYFIRAEGLIPAVPLPPRTYSFDERSASGYVDFDAVAWQRIPPILTTALFLFIVKKRFIRTQRTVAVLFKGFSPVCSTILRR